MTHQQQHAVIRMVDRFLISQPVRDIMGHYDPLDKNDLTKRLERVMRSSVLQKNTEILECAIATMKERVDAL